MVVVSLIWMYFSCSRARSLKFAERVDRQKQRAERLGRLVFLTDRRQPSAEGRRASPVMGDDDHDADEEAGAAAAFAAAAGSERLQQQPPAEESESDAGKSKGLDSNGRGSAPGVPQNDETPSEDSVLHLLANLSRNDPHLRNLQLDRIFERHRIKLEEQEGRAGSQSSLSARLLLEPILQTWLHHWNQDVLENAAGGTRWVRPYLLPQPTSSSSLIQRDGRASPSSWVRHQYPEYFAIVRRNHRMKWQQEWDALSEAGRQRDPFVDYTSPDKYTYPVTPSKADNPVLPRLQPLGELMDQWKQNDDQPGRIRETLVRFEYTISQHIDAATQYRSAGIPFIVGNVPDAAAARLKWTDEYLSEQFDGGRGRHELLRVHPSPPSIEAVARESVNNVFVPYEADKWDIFRLGLTPTRDVTDWTYAQWSRHARYADAVRLGADQPHFAWQAQPRALQPPPSDPSSDPSVNETFVIRDLHFMTAANNHFFAGNRSTLRCHYGERGMVTAISFEADPTFITVVTGAVRYMLIPPTTAPSLLCVHSSPDSALYRHSALDLAHISLTKSPDPANKDVSVAERDCLKSAATVDAVDTVVKAGEVLYIPSVSLQKSAQCTVHSGS